MTKLQQNTADYYLYLYLTTFCEKYGLFSEFSQAILDELFKKLQDFSESYSSSNYYFLKIFTVPVLN